MNKANEDGHKDTNINTVRYFHAGVDSFQFTDTEFFLTFCQTRGSRC